MSVCDCEDICDFYKALTFRLGLAVFFLTQYCHSPFFKDCARHVIYSQGAYVPADLYPNQSWRLPSLLGMSRERTRAG